MTVMEHQVRLLRQLTIDDPDRSTGEHRPAPVLPPLSSSTGGRRPLLALAAVGVVALGAAALWSLQDERVSPTVAAASPAKAPPAATAPSGADGLTASGYIVARRVATVSAQVTGRLIDVPVEEGAVVSKGQLLARLDASAAAVNLRDAQASYRATLAQIDSAQANLAEAELRRSRAALLSERGFVSRADSDRIDAEVTRLSAAVREARERADGARVNIDRQSTSMRWHEVRAPFSGVIVDKNAQPGEIVSPLSAGGFTRTGIYTIVDMDSLEVEVDVNEANIQRIAPGQPARIVLTAYPDLVIRGSVAAIVPTANRDRATIRVRVRLDTSDPHILPEMEARVTFESLPPSNPPAPRS